MESNGSPVLGLLGFWMTMQLVTLLALLLGGIYALYCLGRAASGLDRLASAMEEWVNRQGPAAGSTPSAGTPSYPAPGGFAEHGNPVLPIVPLPPPAPRVTAPPVTTLPAPASPPEVPLPPGQ